MSDQYNYVANLDIDQILKAFDAVDKRADKTAANMGAAFKRVKTASGTGTGKAAASAKKEVDQFDKTLKKLIASELRAAAGADKVTKEFISLAASAANTSQDLVTAAGSTTRLSSAQVTFAKNVAISKVRLAEYTRELSKEGADVVSLTAKIRALTSSLNRLDDAQEKSASTAQRSTANFRKQIAEIPKQTAAAKKAAETTTSGANKSSAAMSILAGATAAVVNQLIQLGRKAATAFTAVIKGAVDTAIKFEGVERSFQAVFGDPSIADAVFDRIQERSRELGVDLTQLSRKFLPIVGSVEEALKFGELAAGLALFDPDQGITGALISLQELAVGDVVSLRKRFELPTGKIQELQKELGNVEGALVGLGQLLDERGVSLKQLGDIAQITFAIMRSNVKQLQGTLGEPLLEELNEQFMALNEFVEENRDELELIAFSIGDIFAAIAEFSGDSFQEFLEGLDLEDIINDLQDLVNTISAIQVASEAMEDRPFAGFFDDLKESVGIGTEGLLDIQEAARGLIGVIGLLDASLKTVASSFAIIAVIGIATLDGTISSMEEFEAAVSGGAKALVGVFVGEIQQAQDQLAKLDGSLQENSDRLADRRAEQAKSAEEDLEAADALLALTNATQQLADANSELADASADVREKVKAAQDASVQGFIKAEIDLQRKLFDIDQDASDDRIDLARKTLIDIQDLRRKFADALEDQELKLTRSEEDIALKNADRLLKVEEDSTKKRLDNEEDFRNKLAAIRRKFDFRVEEAIRDNDAVKVLSLRRQAEFELNEARILNDQKKSEEDSDREENRNKAKEDNERAIRDAGIANRRKLEDLEKNLARQIQAQQRAVDQELENLAIVEARKREAAELDFVRTQEDLNRQLQLKLSTLMKSLDDEVAAVKDAELRKSEAVIAGIKFRLEANVAFFKAFQRAVNTFVPKLPTIGGFGFNQGGSSVPGGDGPDANRGAGFGGRQLGGSVNQGEPVMVGEPLSGGRANPEVFVPGSDGYIFPLNRMMFSPGAAGAGGGTSIDNSRSLSADINIPDPNGLSPIQKSQVVSIATEMLIEASRG